MAIHTFTDADRQQRWFRSLEESLEARLKTLREKNDRDQSETDTAMLRGRISEVRELLKDMQQRSPLEVKAGRVNYT